MIKIKEIAKMIGGTVVGDGDIEISGLKSIPYARKGDMTFAAEKDHLALAEKSEASCILTTLDAKDVSKPAIQVKDIKIALTLAFNIMTGMARPEKGNIHPSAIVDKTSQIGQNVSMGPAVVVGKNSRIGDNSFIGANSCIGENVKIGFNVRIFPTVTIYDNTSVGNNVIIHAGCVIGADGFGYIPHAGKILKVPQLGGVVIGDNVEIGANTCIDRGAFTDTVIGSGTKIDNLVQVGHNSKIGSNVLIAGQSGISGSVNIGDGTMLGGQAGIADHINIGRNVQIGAQSGVFERNVPDGTVLFGYPAKDARSAMKEVALLSWLNKNAFSIRKILKGKSNE